MLALIRFFVTQQRRISKEVIRVKRLLSGFYCNRILQRWGSKPKYIYIYVCVCVCVYTVKPALNGPCIKRNLS